MKPSVLFSYITLTIGILLLALNLFGFIKTTRISNLSNVKEMRFENDITIQLPEFQKMLKEQPDETDEAYTKRIVKVIANGLAHIHSYERTTLDRFFRIKPWDNWLLYFASYIPQEEWREYHYMHPMRTVKRGVGYCGDAALLITWLLERRGLNPRITCLPGHVIAEVALSHKDTLFLDADFGVWAKGSVSSIKSDTATISQTYRNAGFKESDIKMLLEIYAGDIHYINSHKDFGPKKLLLENILYILKWLIPVVLIGFSILTKKNKTS